MEVKRQWPAMPPAGATQAFQQGDKAAMPDAATNTELLYEEKDSVATLTMNRLEKLSAFRGITYDTLIHASNRAGWNKAIVVFLASSGR